MLQKVQYYRLQITMAFSVNGGCPYKKDSGLCGERYMSKNHVMLLEPLGHNQSPVSPGIVILEHPSGREVWTHHSINQVYVYSTFQQRG